MYRAFLNACFGRFKVGLKDLSLVLWNFDTHKCQFHFTAPQYHFGWAVAKNITLITSGYHDPESGSRGSGIFDGKYQIVRNFTYSAGKKSDFITSNLKSVHQENSQDDSINIGIGKPFYLYEDLSKYTKMSLRNGKQELTLKHKNLECFFNYEYNGTVSYNILAYEGNRTFNDGKFTEPIQVCGIVTNCTDCKVNDSIFKSIKISSSFTTPATVIPVGLHLNLCPVFNMTYISNGNYKETKVEDKDLYSFGLFSRVYNVSFD